MLRPPLYDYSDAYIIVKSRIRIDRHGEHGTAAEQVAVTLAGIQDN